MSYDDGRDMGQKIRSSARSLHAVYVYGQSVGNSVATGVDLSKYWGEQNIVGKVSGGEMAPSLGGRKTFSRTKISE